MDNVTESGTLPITISDHLPVFLIRKKARIQKEYRQIGPVATTMSSWMPPYNVKIDKNEIYRLAGIKKFRIEQNHTY